jgi:hypothetical protein
MRPFHFNPPRLTAGNLFSGFAEQCHDQGSRASLKRRRLRIFTVRDFAPAGSSRQRPWLQASFSAKNASERERAKSALFFS